MSLIILINSMLSGGAEKQLLLLATGLSRRGFRCSVYWFQATPDHPRTAKLMAEARAQGVSFYPPTPGKQFDLSQVGRVRKRLQTAPGTMLWTWGARTEIVGLISRLGLRGIRQIGSMRSAHPERILQQRFLWRLLAKTHSAFVSNSHLNRSQIGDVAPALLARTAVIYNAVESLFFDQPAPASDRPKVLTIVMLGNQNAWTKGYDIALRVAILIRERSLPFRIRIGGTPLMMEALDEQFRAADVADIISLAGRIDEPVNFLRSGNVFMLLSRYEGIPNALLEAMALGLPAVSTPVGDVPAFATDRLHLRLVDHDPQHVLAALTELWEAWPLACAMGAAGRSMCRTTFSYEAALNATELFLREVHATGSFRALAETTSGEEPGS
jgi:GalNAc-alpha-(1->4)-GalNAc-alpha-(1->3)-diNAcBac-PP-undecaprenol alpha-1,4-N-acetyl-D-galactosaminyltransferase